MNWGYILPPLFLSAIAFLLICIVLWYGGRKFINRIFALFLLTYVFWGIIIFFMRSSSTLDEAHLWERWIVIDTLSSAIFLYHFSLCIGRINHNLLKNIVRAAYILLIIECPLIPTNLFIKAMQLKSYGYAPVLGPLFYIHILIVYSLIILSMVILLRHRQTAETAHQKNQISYIVIGMIFMLILGIFDFLPLLGLPLYPGGIIGNIIFSLLATIAIVKHHLLDINIILRKGTAYFLTSAVLAIPYVLLIFFIRMVSETFQFLPVVTFLFLLVIAFALQPIWLFIQQRVDRIFFRQRYNQLKALEQFANDTQHIIELQKLSDTMTDMMGKAMEASVACVLMSDLKSECFLPISCYNFKINENLLLPFKSAIIRYIKSHDGYIHRYDFNNEPTLRALTMMEIQILRETKAELIVPLKTKDSFSGLLILGPKLSELDYSDDDLRLLTIVTRQLSVSFDNSRLYNQAKKAYEELGKAQEQLIRAERLKALGEMTTGIAHNFNNMLAVILGRAQMLLVGLKRDKYEIGKLRKNAELIEQAAMDAAQMVKRLQDSARIRSDRNFSVVDINELVKNAIAMLKPLIDKENPIGRAKIELELNLDKPMKVEAAAGELRESFLNILINAVEAMPDGGRLAVATCQNDSTCMVVISDTGIGITAETKERLFEPFFSTKGSKGLGIGLSTAYGIISRHRGSINVASEVGRGSTFTISLPIALHTSNINKARNKIQLKNATVLIVEDDPGAKEVLYEMLFEEGVHIDVAANGNDALSRINQNRYDLIISDLGLPDISGFDVLSSAKNIDPDVNTVLITGWGAQIGTEKHDVKMVDAVVTKPFKREMILSTLAMLLESGSNTKKRIW